MATIEIDDKRWAGELAQHLHELAKICPDPLLSKYLSNGARRAEMIRDGGVGTQERGPR